MKVSNNDDHKLNKIIYITQAEIKQFLKKSRYTSDDTVIENYSLHNASDKMLGFLSDYWKLEVCLSHKNNKKEVLHFFIKAVSRSNLAKADMVRELNLFEKELTFYSMIKKNIKVPVVKPWSAELVATLNEAMVFQDLNVLQYKHRNKFERFDILHVLQALKTLARFHASSLIFEEKKSKELRRPYRINEEYGNILDEGGYCRSSVWFIQCMMGALGAVKTFSKYSKNKLMMNKIENRWSDVWFSTLSLSDFSSEHRNVICHRDLWNNNILFHYKNTDENKLVPDDCLLVDFQAVRCQPPAGDVMLLLYCNVDPRLREENMDKFLNYYYEELTMILKNNRIATEDIININQFIVSAQEERQWGLILCACLIPQFWIDDNLTTKIFGDTAQFHEILSKDKESFIKKMMHENEDYKEKVMEIFDEIVERYCINENN